MRVWDGKPTLGRDRSVVGIDRGAVWGGHFFVGPETRRVDGMQGTSAVRVDTANGHKDAVSEVLGLLRQSKVQPASVAQAFDRMSHAERVAAIRATGRREQSRLWKAVDGFAPLSLIDMVPAACADNQQVRHYGKNSLPLFTHFEKRFLRPAGQDAARPTELHGYNFQESAIATSFSGPGYFIAVDDPKRSEVLIDYYRVPTTRPEGWPSIRNNERGGARLVYGFMIDTLRRVSEHVTIGHANKHGKDMSAWFILCRDAE